MATPSSDAESLSRRGGSAAIDRMLAGARSRFIRCSPAAAHAAAGDGGLIVDIRSERQRLRQGRVPGARFVERNVLEWRADPSCPHHDPVLVGVAGRLIIMCAQGYQSSLAAAALIELGVANATDLEGGYERWYAEGLPTVGAPPRIPAHDVRAGASHPATAPRGSLRADP